MCFGCHCQVPSCLVEQLVGLGRLGYILHTYTYVFWILVLHVAVNQICLTVCIIRNLFNSLNTQLVLFKFIAVVVLSRSFTPPQQRAVFLSDGSVKCLALPVSHISYGSWTACDQSELSCDENAIVIYTMKKLFKEVFSDIILVAFRKYI